MVRSLRPYKTGVFMMRHYNSKILENPTRELMTPILTESPIASDTENIPAEKDVAKQNVRQNPLGKDRQTSHIYI